MKQKKLNSDLRMRIRNCLEHTHIEFQENEQEEQKKVLSRLSLSLKQEMNEDIFKEFIFENNLFTNLFSNEFLKHILYYIEEILVSPGQLIFKEGEDDDSSIYFLFEGKIEITLNQQTVQIITGGRTDEKQKQRKGTMITQLKKMEAEKGGQINNILQKVRNSFKKKVKNISMLEVLKNLQKKRKSQQNYLFDLNKLAEEQSEIQKKKKTLRNNHSIDEHKKIPPKYFGEHNFFSRNQKRLFTAQSSTFSRLYKLKRSTFLAQIKDFQQDFEKFIEIQDQIILFKSSKRIQNPCICCESLNHSHPDCKFLHISLNHDQIIEKFIKNEDNQRQKIQRFRKKSLSALISQTDLEKQIETYQEEHFNSIDDFIQQQELEHSSNESDFNDDDSYLLQIENPHALQNHNLSNNAQDCHRPRSLAQNSVKLNTDIQFNDADIVDLINSSTNLEPNISNFIASPRNQQSSSNNLKFIKTSQTEKKVSAIKGWNLLKQHNQPLNLIQNNRVSELDKKEIKSIELRVADQLNNLFQHIRKQSSKRLKLQDEIEKQFQIDNPKKDKEVKKKKTTTFMIESEVKKDHLQEGDNVSEENIKQTQRYKKSILSSKKNSSEQIIWTLLQNKIQDGNYANDILRIVDSHFPKGNYDTKGSTDFFQTERVKEFENYFIHNNIHAVLTSFNELQSLKRTLQQKRIKRIMKNQQKRKQQQYEKSFSSYMGRNSPRQGDRSQLNSEDNFISSINSMQQGVGSPHFDTVQMFSQQ